MKVQFKEYLHEEWEDVEFDWLFKDTPIADWSDEEKDALLQKMGRPFYEVTVICEVDTETGKVTLLEAKL